MTSGQLRQSIHFACASGLGASHNPRPLRHSHTLPAPMSKSLQRFFICSSIRRKCHSHSAMLTRTRSSAHHSEAYRFQTAHTLAKSHPDGFSNTYLNKARRRRKRCIALHDIPQHRPRLRRNHPIDTAEPLEQPHHVWPIFGQEAP